MSALYRFYCNTDFESETPILLQNLVLSINHLWYAQTLLISEPTLYQFKNLSLLLLTKIKVVSQIWLFPSFLLSNVWLRAYAYINNLYRFFHYRTIKNVPEKISKKFPCIILNIEGYTAVSASVILLLSKMQQKPRKAAKAPYIQLLSLEGECNFLMDFIETNKYFSLKLHLNVIFEKKSDLQINSRRYDNQIGGFCSISRKRNLVQLGQISCF